ncbi:methylated-DNA--[protein]-cysteine S-methyltransferase [Haloferax mediterranei ATCC 33500]|uniref:6-O-methylguanine DNA methyltransferase n=1 Tax=Haloferax mediterranei (strain ATCC 33500 / DSM 1411 / JCM 8866 / NBRC 14739 / NCIMB 2177 / R-4) TaxID=523841 RepID=I3R2L3_HALMT|nr:methylated-DNA--[protein]-cysteine S-methyltransferase [Haloferax mediterranei]AFK18473.1 6-O-methylguanine DNA methyltransferase [Haloferax mediterranei ATCC 33500]AHZ22143.1 cysteine methyltransferase [Haloferax mediterranei ATCC 33500]EMA02253.1 6-O-methylguanine DNA methyltransferase [Haloferax mediterranei ATCC 33500]MDX5988564.1 methylated-DNA--[protein]-cysteine S-methyltransferase [Haloferax mediterranei ATCC 33500]QCQ74977.1 methylated-DNA--[protein]-cysteine S-methyltransferase [H
MHVTMWGFDVELDERLVDTSADDLCDQLSEYEQGARRSFDADVHIPDSFTGDVMRAMLDIPYGETRTYGQIAEVVGSHPVAIGQACGRNPVPLVVPCHRVVGSDSLGGFSAAGGTDLKRALLAHERDEETEQLVLSAYRS